MTARKTKETPVTEEVEPWGEVEEEVPVKRDGRSASPLLLATKEFEAAHKKADAARAKLAKIQPVIDKIADLEAAEQATWETLQSELKAVGN